MTSVAKRRVSGGLASTEKHFAIFLCSVFQRRELRILVTSITEGLGLAFSARAPKVILSGFDFDWVRRLLGDFRLRHGSLQLAIALDLLRIRPLTRSDRTKERPI